MDTTIIRLIKLPPTIRGLTVPDADGNYNIYINCNLGYKVQIGTYCHEEKHIKNNDFCSNKPVIVLENRAKSHEEIIFCLFTKHMFFFGESNYSG